MTQDSWSDQIDEALQEQDERADTIKIPTVQSQDESGESVAIRILLGMAVVMVFLVVIGVVGCGIWTEVRFIQAGAGTPSTTASQLRQAVSTPVANW